MICFVTVPPGNGFDATGASSEVRSDADHEIHLHGYDIARWILETSRETLRVDEGALYTALHRMENRGWLESEWGISDNNRRAKFYQLTAKGRAQLRRSTADWTRYAEAVFLVLRAS